VLVKTIFQKISISRKPILSKCCSFECSIHQRISWKSHNIQFFTVLLYFDEINAALVSKQWLSNTLEESYALQTFEW